MRRALGVGGSYEPDTAEFAVEDGDLFVLCTDGLNAQISDEEIGQVLVDCGPELERAADELIDLAITICAHSEMFVAPGYEARVAELWSHAVASGIYAKEIARALRDNVESAYLCGLLHGLGRPIVLRELATVSAEGLDDDQVAAVIDALHREVGVRAAASWNLPDAVTEAIEYCGRFGEAPGRGTHATLATLAVALANHALDPVTHPEDELRHDPAVAALAFYPEDLDPLIEMADEVRGRATEGLA